MSKILSATISTLSFPTVECNAGNCLLMLVISTISPSIIDVYKRQEQREHVEEQVHEVGMDEAVAQ